MKLPQVGIIMGSINDLPVMEKAAQMLASFDIAYELTIVSAHRTPDRMFQYARTAHTRGLKVIIAGAGGAAHLPGMIASLTTLPVIGVPIKSSLSLDGWDAVLSILQMPPGIPVATVALNNAQNAALLAASILALHNESLANKMNEYKLHLTKNVEKMVEETIKKQFPNYFDSKEPM